MKRKTGISIIAALMSCALLVFGLLTAPPADALTKIRFVTAAGRISPLLAFVTVAQQKGYFKAEGVEVDLTAVRGSTAAIQLLTGGKIDFVMASPDPLVKATGKDTNLDIMDVFTFVQESFFPFAVRHDSPIKSIAELKGKKIGVPSLGSGAVFAAKIYLKDVGINPNSMELIPIGHGPRALKAIREGQVDAVVHWDGGFAIMETLGGKFRYFPKTKTIAKLFGTGVVGRRSFTDQNKQATKGFLRGLLKGILFTIHNPEASLKIHWDVYKPKKSSPKAFKNMLHVFRVRNPKMKIGIRGVTKYGYHNPGDWELLVGVHDLKGKVDPKKLYTNEFIDYANDFDIPAFINKVKAIKM